MPTNNTSYTPAPATKPNQWSQEHENVRIMLQALKDEAYIQNYITDYYKYVTKKSSSVPNGDNAYRDIWHYIVKTKTNLSPDQQRSLANDMRRQLIDFVYDFVSANNQLQKAYKDEISANETFREIKATGANPFQTYDGQQAYEKKRDALANIPTYEGEVQWFSAVLLDLLKKNINKPPAVEQAEAALAAQHAASGEVHSDNFPTEPWRDPKLREAALGSFWFYTLKGGNSGAGAAVREYIVAEATHTPPRFGTMQNLKDRARTALRQYFYDAKDYAKQTSLYPIHQDMWADLVVENELKAQIEKFRTGLLELVVLRDKKQNMTGPTQLVDSQIRDKEVELLSYFNGSLKDIVDNPPQSHAISAGGKIFGAPTAAATSHATPLTSGPITAVAAQQHQAGASPRQWNVAPANAATYGTNNQSNNTLQPTKPQQDQDLKDFWNLLQHPPASILQQRARNDAAFFQKFMHEYYVYHVKGNTFSFPSWSEVRNKIENFLHDARVTDADAKSHTIMASMTHHLDELVQKIRNLPGIDPSRVAEVEADIQSINKNMLNGFLSGDVKQFGGAANGAGQSTTSRPWADRDQMIEALKGFRQWGALGGNSRYLDAVDMYVAARKKGTIVPPELEQKARGALRMGLKDVEPAASKKPEDWADALMEEIDKPDFPAHDTGYDRLFSAFSAVQQASQRRRGATPARPTDMRDERSTPRYR